MSDAVWLLDHLFVANVDRLPCEGGRARDPGPGERALLDSNGDGSIDLSDGVHLLAWLFLGDSRPVLGTDCARILGCPEGCGP